MTPALPETVNGPAPPQPEAPHLQCRHAARATPPGTLDSTALLQGGKTVTIRHNGELYRLQATRQGKLILTK